MNFQFYYGATFDNLNIDKIKGLIMAELVISKKVRKQLRELISKAYTQELNNHLHELSLSFDEWRNNKIDCWDLNDIIHKFHDGISRDLYKLYNYCRDEIFLVSRAVAQKLIQLDEVPTEVRGMLSDTAIRFFGSDDTSEAL